MIDEVDMGDMLSDRSLPVWFDEAKFGIAIHWGLFSVPAWAPQRVAGIIAQHQTVEYQNWLAVPDSQTAQYHAEHYGDLAYEGFADMFRASSTRWDPEVWADLFERAGARYVVLTAKNMDGFLLWPSARPHPRKQNWQVERDLVGELAAAVRARGMRFGTYYTGYDWTFSERALPIVDDRQTVMPTSREWIEYADAHWRELIERYEPDVLWSDYGYANPLEWKEDLFRWYLERVPDGVINDRFDPREVVEHDQPHPERGVHDDPWKGMRVHRDFRTLESIRPERGNPKGYGYSAAPVDKKWESIREFADSYGYNRRETEADYPTSSELIQELCEVVARGGNLLLNVGPTASGEIPWLQAERLLAIGSWLHRHGDAIYRTRTWEQPTETTGDGLDVYYTASDTAVYATVPGTPKVASIELDVHLDDGATVIVDGQPGPLTWHTTDKGVRVDLSEEPAEQPAVVLRLSPQAAVRPTP